MNKNNNQERVSPQAQQAALAIKEVVGHPLTEDTLHDIAVIVDEAIVSRVAVLLNTTKENKNGS
jgi:hypothetical protein